MSEDDKVDVQVAVSDFCGSQDFGKLDQFWDGSLGSGTSRCVSASY